MSSDPFQFLDEKELKIEPSPAKHGKSRQDLFRTIFTFVFNAVRKRKVYCIGRGFTCAKRFLQTRGWINIGKGVTNSKQCLKRIDHKLAVHHNLTVLQENAKAALRNKDFIKDKRGIFLFLIADFVPNYIWITHRSDVRWNFLAPDQLVNKFPRVIFTTKTGLNRILNEDSHIISVSESFYPRCYELNDTQTLERFLDDYKFTACSGVLRWFHERSWQGRVVEEPTAATGKASLSAVISFCLTYCNRRMTLVSESTDTVEQQDKMPFSWQILFQNSYTLVKKDYIEIENRAVHQSLYERTRNTLAEIRVKVPQSVIDGQKNVWILKPGHSSQGKGIIIRIKLEDILTKEHRKNLVIQKYIERPLLIYDTKFDIRQWFVVTSWTPLIVWMNKISYLRFCSQIFTYESFHESVHLSNNAIQAKYSNAPRSKNLPVENMWTCEQFEDFLREKGCEDKWSTKIYPGMVHAITECMVASKQKMVGGIRQQSFELFGADFMITQDFNPWLIEINASPALGPSTAITARLVPILLKDILALTTNPNPKTASCVGSLVCIYSQEDEERKKSSSSSSDRRRIDPEQVRMIDYIDKVMSVPSCIYTDNASKVSMLKRWLSTSSLKVKKPSPPPPPQSKAEKQQQQQQQRRQRNAAQMKKEETAAAATTSSRPRFVQSAPQFYSDVYCGGGGGSGTNASVRKIVKNIPVCTDERLLFKYKCRHGL